MIIRDEIHGNMEFSDLEEKIIDTATFQRLRRIKQMSVANLVYPGATHTRFEHSLGTAHLTERIGRKIDLNLDEISKIKLYGLLHDIGHTAFSHEGEDVVKKYIGNHEELGKKLITSGEIGEIISENYDPKQIAKMGSDKGGLGSIVTSDLGADRMDYLKRDALNTGVAYGLIDIERLIHTLEFSKAQICIQKRGLESAEFLLTARFMMFSAVYMHKTVRIATAMLYRAIEGAILDQTIMQDDLCKIEDEIALWRMTKSEKGGKYAKGIIDRDLYKEVYAISKSQINQKRAKELEEEITKKFKIDTIVDYPNTYFKPISIKVASENGELEPITQMSSLVNSLKEAEEQRAEVIIAASKKDKQKFGKKIIELIN